MSIVVAVKVPEGLVLAADSASTLQVTQQGGQTGVAMIYNNANKLIRLKDYPIGIATWGAGNMGARTFISYIEEFENTLEPYESCCKQINVKQIAARLRSFILRKYEEQGLSGKPAEQLHNIGVIIGGYSAGQFLSEHYVFGIPQGELTEARPNLESGEPDFGANWYGAADAIVRLHFGRDDRVFQIFERLGASKELVEQAKKVINSEIQYPIPFAAMPLRDAIDYAEYVVSVVVGRFRFVVGAPLCGGPIDVAAINRKEGFRWFKHKQ